ncbi:MAG: type II secretion system protein [Desulfobacterales bacterium]|nr:type II secretion system protein [Desulfobacterales bacterium]
MWFKTIFYKWFKNNDFRKNTDSGFTLVEVIVTMLLVGVMAALTGMGIAIFMQGYVTTRENVDIAQKAALAMERITRELEALTEIDVTSDATCIRYRIGTESDNFRRIQYYDNQIQLDLTSTVNCDGTEDGKTLTDRVEAGSFSLGYESGTGTASSPPTAFRDLLAIHLAFHLERKDALAANDFSLAINPRNTGVMKGVGISP